MAAADFIHIGLDDFTPRYEFICRHGSDEPCVIEVYGREKRGHLCGTPDQMRRYAHRILEALERAEDGDCGAAS